MAFSGDSSQLFVAFEGANFHKPLSWQQGGLVKFTIACVLSCALLAASDPKKTEIRGIVTDEAAAVIEHGRIELNCERSKSKPASSSATETNAKGEFALEHALAGACTIKISSPLFHSVQVSLGPPNKRPMELGTIRLSAKN